MSANTWSVIVNPVSGDHGSVTRVPVASVTSNSKVAVSPHPSEPGTVTVNAGPVELPVELGGMFAKLDVAS